MTTLALADCYSEKYLRQGGRQPREDCSSFGLSIGALDVVSPRRKLQAELVHRQLSRVGSTLLTSRRKATSNYLQSSSVQLFLPCATVTRLTPSRLSVPGFSTISWWTKRVIRRRLGSTISW
jgi:hypothetical protein